MAKAYEVTGCLFCPHHNRDYSFSRVGGGGYVASQHCRKMGRPIKKMNLVAGGMPDWCPLPDMPKEEGGQ